MDSRSSSDEAHEARYRIWLLYLVPKVKHERWWCASIVFVVLAATFAAAGAFSLHGGPMDRSAWPAALFFCVIMAYITPVFHFITHRTEEAFDALTPHLSSTPSAIARQRQTIASKSAAWLVANTAIGASLWMIQSWLLAGSVDNMTSAISHSTASFAMSVGPLLVWISLTCAVHCLVDNARLFRRLTSQVHIDLLDTGILTPFGHMAVSSTLMVIGSQASFSIMWLDAGTDPWTTIPGLIPTTIALAFLFVAPVWPIHRALKATKREELTRLQTQINAARDSREDVHNYTSLAPLLAYRREILSIHEWPFDLSLMARLGLYLVIVPLTWIGAALIENMVDVFVN